MVEFLRRGGIPQGSGGGGSQKWETFGFVHKIKYFFFTKNRCEGFKSSHRDFCCESLCFLLKLWDNFSFFVVRVYIFFSIFIEKNSKKVKKYENFVFLALKIVFAEKAQFYKLCAPNIGKTRSKTLKLKGVTLSFFNNFGNIEFSWKKLLFCNCNFVLSSKTNRKQTWLIYIYYPPPK